MYQLTIVLVFTVVHLLTDSLKHLCWLLRPSWLKFLCWHLSTCWPTAEAQNVACCAPADWSTGIDCCTPADWTDCLKPQYGLSALSFYSVDMFLWIERATWFHKEVKCGNLSRNWIFFQQSFHLFCLRHYSVNIEKKKYYLFIHTIYIQYTVSPMCLALTVPKMHVVFYSS
jgi:hypothetical protein